MLLATVVGAWYSLPRGIVTGDTVTVAFTTVAINTVVGDTVAGNTVVVTTVETHKSQPPPRASVHWADMLYCGVQASPGSSAD